MVSVIVCGIGVVVIISRCGVMLVGVLVCN